MTSWNIQKLEQGWRLPLEQRNVSRCTVDHAFSLEFYESEETAVLRIEGEFTIRDGDRIYRLNPEVPTELGPAVALHGKVIRSATSAADGMLVLTFEDGRTLSVKPDASYEAWGLSNASSVYKVETTGLSVVRSSGVESRSSATRISARVGMDA